MTHSPFPIGSGLRWELAWTSILPRHASRFPLLLKCQDFVPTPVCIHQIQSSPALCFSSSFLLLSLSLSPYPFSLVLGGSKSIYGNILSFIPVRHERFQFITRQARKLEAKAVKMTYCKHDNLSWIPGIHVFKKS